MDIYNTPIIKNLNAPCAFIFFKMFHSLFKVKKIKVMEPGRKATSFHICI